MNGPPALLHEFFEHQARQQPDAIAIEVPPGWSRPTRLRLSYAQLERAAAILGARLAPRVRGECVVAIDLPRGEPLLYAAQIAVSQVGAAWVALDRSHPTERRRLVLEDSRAVALITDAAGCADLGGGSLPTEAMIDVAASSAAEDLVPRDATLPWLRPSSLVYVTYTSGTTGRPKGVMIEHRGVVSLIASDLERFGIRAGDRVAQGSSPAYDSSVEETWSTLAGGGTVVVMDEEATRLGPDLVGWLRDEDITILMPTPTLLRTMAVEDPAHSLPKLRLVYVGGEALPQDLADRWAPGLWLENGYGPTECTVTVVRGRHRPGEPPNIGTAVPGNRAWVLTPDLEEVAEGEPGELCIGGVGLARGYLGQADLSAQRFVEHPRHGRIYRTGDLVRRDPAGRLLYLGRADQQVKIRGHRIELEAVETRLAEIAGVREAACRVQGSGPHARLVAFVVATDGEAPPALDSLAAVLGRTLPAAMVPARFALLDALPTTVGGKLDRGALPDIEAERAAPRPEGEGPRDALEALIQETLARALGIDHLGIHDDFFARGGDSLRAAEAISLLRGHDATAALATRDVYEVRSVAGLAERARSRPRAQPSARPALPRATAARGRPRLFTAVQVTWLALELVGGSLVVYALLFLLLPILVSALGLVPLLLLLPVFGAVFAVVYVPASVVLAALAKRLLIGCYLPGRAPAWGSLHLRNWLVQHVVRLVPWGLLQGTVFQSVALRALGARIGRRVHIHRGVDLLSGGWDLLTIGDDVTLSQDASVGLVEIDDGHLVIAPVTLDDGCTLEVRAGVSGDTAVGRGARLTALSALAAGSRIPAGERWDGVPAEPAGAAPAAPAVSPLETTMEPHWHGLLLVIARWALGVLVAAPFLALVITALIVSTVSGETVLAWLFAPAASPGFTTLLLVALTLAVPVGLIWRAGVLRLLGAAPPGVCSRWGRPYIRIWLRSGLVQSAGRWLSGTLFWPWWLRLAGMRIGRGCEVSTIIDVLPEHLELGEECFLADGIYLGGAHLDRGTVSVAPTVLAERTFLGNHVVVPAGARLAPDLLLGVCTVADAARIPAGSSWFGHPAFALPRREVVTADRSLTHDPGPVRYLTRLFWELLRFPLAAAFLFITLAWFELAGRAAAAFAGGPGLLAALPAVTLAVAAAAVTAILALKWLLLGRVRPGQHVFWSCWCSRWDCVYVAWQFLARPVLARLEGTLILAWYLRAMGARIGRCVLLGGGFAQVVDPDMITIEDGATVQVMFQAHSFEDRILKVDRIRIGSRATVRRATVILYGAELGEECRVEPHGVVMKRERLLAGERYEGCPARPAAAEPLPAATSWAERDRTGGPGS